MALSDDLRGRVVGAVVGDGMSRNAAAKRFGVGIASAVRWVARFNLITAVEILRLGSNRASSRV
jgi:transposase